MAAENWFQHVLERRPWQTQRQAFALATLSFFVALIIGGLYLAQAAASSTTGRQLAELINTRNQIEQANEQLRAEIARLQSVPRLRERAQQLGFVEARRENIEYLIVPGYNPQGQQAVTAALPPPRPVPSYDETFLGWLEQQWDTFINQRQLITPVESLDEE
jgi:hypothetical protein